jgi:hypothetical protein
LFEWGAVALFLLSASFFDAQPANDQPRYKASSVRGQIIVRIPFLSRRPVRPIEWKEGKGPRCLPARAIAGAALAGRDKVDFILRDRRRVRAELEDNCPALDYYYGFYLSPPVDGQVCADRDAIRSRVGGQCGIDRFRALTAVTED